VKVAQRRCGSGFSRDEASRVTRAPRVTASASLRLCVRPLKESHAEAQRRREEARQSGYRESRSRRGLSCFGVTAIKARPSPRNITVPCGSGLRPRCGAAANPDAAFLARPVAAEAAPTASLRDFRTRSLDGAQRNPGSRGNPLIACVSARPAPDCAALHPGYGGLQRLLARSRPVETRGPAFDSSQEEDLFHAKTQRRKVFQCDISVVWSTCRVTGSAPATLYSPLRSWPLCVINCRLVAQWQWTGGWEGNKTREQRIKGAAGGRNHAHNGTR
jgi:hypothetical protein